MRIKIEGLGDVELDVEERLVENMSVEDLVYLASLVEEQIQENPHVLKTDGIQIRVPFTSDTTVIRFNSVNLLHDEEAKRKKSNTKVNTRLRLLDQLKQHYLIGRELHKTTSPVVYRAFLEWLQKEESKEGLSWLQHPENRLEALEQKVECLCKKICGQEEAADEENNNCFCIDITSI